MIIKGKPYAPPPAPFKKGDRVKLSASDTTYTVIASSHTHTQLEGVRYAIANWKLRLYRSPARK